MAQLERPQRQVDASSKTPTINTMEQLLRGKFMKKVGSHCIRLVLKHTHSVEKLQRINVTKNHCISFKKRWLVEKENGYTILLKKTFIKIQPLIISIFFFILTFANQYFFNQVALSF